MRLGVKMSQSVSAESFTTARICLPPQHFLCVQVFDLGVQVFYLPARPPHTEFAEVHCQLIGQLASFGEILHLHDRTRAHSTVSKSFDLICSSEFSIGIDGGMVIVKELSLPRL
jgi:hypothetical protein